MRLFKPASDFHTLPQKQQTKSFSCAFPLCSSEPGPGVSWGVLLGQIDSCTVFRTFHMPNDWCEGMPHSWLVVFQHGYTDDWLYPCVWQTCSSTPLADKLWHIWVDIVTFSGCCLYFSPDIRNGFHYTRSFSTHPPISTTYRHFPFAWDRQFCIVLVSPCHSLWNVSSACAVGGSQKIVLHTAAA